MKTRNKTKSVLSALLSAVLLFGSIPQVTPLTSVITYIYCNYITYDR